MRPSEAGASLDKCAATTTGAVGIAVPDAASVDATTVELAA
jgi:hypothetical protein